MNRLVLIAAMALAGGVLFPVLGQAQAAAEYGMAASKSTAIASQARPIFTKGSRLPALRIPPPASKNLQTVMQENRQKLEAKTQNGGGVVRIESVPAKAAIAVDGELIDYAPVELKLPEGKHLIELTHPGYVPWRMEVSVSQQESTSVTAQLENRYRSSITISFQK